MDCHHAILPVQPERVISIMHVIVSYVTRPGHGSEGGVGWAFLLAAAEHVRSTGEHVQAVIDARDFDSVKAELSKLQISSSVTLLPVPIPDTVLSHFGDRRTRGSYLAWRMRARAKVKEICHSQPVSVAHQVTFATATLPPVVGKLGPTRSIWGPLNLPAAPIASEGRAPSLASRGAIWGARELGVLNAKGMNVVVATNQQAADVLTRVHPEVVVEPNIIAEPSYSEVNGQEDDLLTTVGMLTPGKRPWLAIQAMQVSHLRGKKLELIGDGPLRPALESYVNQEGLGRRVSFRGRVPHKEAVERIGASRALLHPSIREGASWVVGEAAAVGVPAVVFEGSGADSTVRMCNNGGQVCSPGSRSLPTALAESADRILRSPRPEPSNRWSASRLPNLLKDWWQD